MSPSDLGPFGLYHLDRTQEIDDGLIEFYEKLSLESRQTVPDEISMITGAYEYTDSFGSLFENVTNVLKITEKEKQSLILDTQNFFKNFSEIVMKKLTEQYSPSLYSYKKIMPCNFVNDLMKLLFKIGILSANSIPSATEIWKVRQILDISYDLCSFIYSHNGNKFPGYFHPLTINEAFTFKLLMNHEFLENPNLFPIFDSILKDFYIKEVDCKRLEKKYFDGNFYKNTILQSLIIIHDSFGKLREKCFSDKIYLKFFSDYNQDKELKAECPSYLDSNAIFEKLTFFKEFPKLSI